jgi:outer membrane immunogenic protein
MFYIQCHHFILTIQRLCGNFAARLEVVLNKDIIARVVLLLILLAPIAGVADAGEAPQPNWNGLYAGVSLGSRTANSDWKTCQGPIVFGGCPNAGFPLWANGNNANLDSTGVRVAGLLGINWQLDRWVLGLESDFGWGDNEKSRKGIPGAQIAGLPHSDKAEVEQSWDTGLRFRAGYLVTPSLLAYGTGGVAWLHKEVRAVCSELVSGTNGNWCIVQPGKGSVSETPVGWTVGSGIEWMFARHWTVRGEYRFAKFGDTTADFFKNAPADSLRVKSSQNTHTVNIGVAYLFNLP